MSEEQLGIKTETKLTEVKDPMTDSEFFNLALVSLISSAISKSAAKKRIGFSKWLLGGAFTIMFALLIDPAKMYEIYGEGAVRTYVVLIIFSCCSGVIFLMAESIVETFMTDKRVTEMLELDLARASIEQKSPSKVPKELTLSDSKTEFQKQVITKVFSEWNLHVFDSKSLVFQTSSLGAVLIGLTLQLLFFSPPEKAASQNTSVVSQRNAEVLNSYYSTQLCKR